MASNAQKYWLILIRWRNNCISFLNSQLIACFDGGVSVAKMGCLKSNCWSSWRGPRSYWFFAEILWKMRAAVILSWRSWKTPHLLVWMNDCVTPEKQAACIVHNSRQCSYLRLQTLSVGREPFAKTQQGPKYFHSSLRGFGQGRMS